MIRTPGMQKREPRIDVRKLAIVVNSDGMEIDALVLDISRNGFRVQVADQLRIGEFVSLHVDGETVGGQVRWVLGNEAGGTFLAPVNSENL